MNNLKKFLGLFFCLALMIAIMPVKVAAAGETVLPEAMNGTWGGSNDTEVVYYNGTYYQSLVKALEAVYLSNPGNTVAEVYCKPGADIGALSHAHVADNLTIYGNGAYESGTGDSDLEIDTYQYARGAYKQDKTSGVYMEKDITITVYSLDGIAAWGQRNTDHTVNLIFENCQNMNRVYISGAKGTNNISLTNCSFAAANGSSANTSVYSNATGTISVVDCDFNGVAVPINLNNKSTGTQTITVTDSTFTDCSTETVATACNAATYAAPIRVLAQDGATSKLSADTVTFTYTNADEASVNGDILLGDGRPDASETMGTVTLSMTDTAADVQVQTTGYYTAEGSKDETKMTQTTVESTEIVNANTEQHFTVSCAHAAMTKTEAKAATCTATGNREYWYCSDCDTYFSDAAGTVKVALADMEIAKEAHAPTVVGKVDVTCTAAGYTGDTVCAVCQDILVAGEVIPATGHTETVINAVDANCGDEGYTGDTVCAVCGELLAAGEVIPAGGEHHWSDWMTEANYDGTVRKCWTCGEAIYQPTGTAAVAGTVADTMAAADTATGAPKTADTSNVMIWIALFAISCCTLVGTEVYRKTR